VGAAWLVSPDYAGATLAGIALVQLSNLAFAAGQVWYRRIVPPNAPVRDREVFALLYLGGSSLTAILVGLNVDMLGAVAGFSAAQAATVLYLGLIPSGLGFYLWNVGVRRSREGTAAAFNNAKVPLAIVVSWLLFEPLPTLASLARTLAALALLIAALWIAETGTQRESG
jgi:drug/metabolite transporter (DMT)-like permease